MADVGVDVDVASLCRLCAQYSDTNTNVFYYDDKVDLVEAVAKYLSIHITINDCLPVSVCQTCLNEMVSFDRFYCMCKRAQITLHEIVEQKHPQSGIAEFKIDALLSNVKTEIVESDIKNEIVSDNDDRFDDDDNVEDDDDDGEDFIPISEFITKKKSLKKKLKSSKNKSKRSKKKHSSSVDLENFIADKESRRKSETRDDEVTLESKKLRKYKRGFIENSFIRLICHECNKLYKNWNALKNHCNSEHNTKAKVLCLCDKYLYTRHSINRHILKHGTYGIKCENCDKTFPTAKALQAHSVIHLPKDQYPYVCTNCAKRFATPLTLKIHEKTHIAKELRYIHPCEVCGVKFTSKSSVRAHISAVHEKLRPYVCDVCGHAFNNKGNLLEHRVLHSDEKVHCCPKCPKKFKTKGTLQRHIDCHGGTSYKCTECSAILNSRRTLRMHMFVHNDICRYVCAFCNKGYKRRKSLKSHMNLHTGERPYSCPWCSRTFADNSNCRIHKRRMHPVELAEYEAIHGAYCEVAKDATEERKIIYNMTFKMPDPKPIIVPQLDIKPLIEEATHNTS